MYGEQNTLINKILEGKMIGLGVAGNFVNHLEQAGEANDFINLKIQDENAPKGIFPFFIPKDKSFLGRNCFNNVNLILPTSNKEYLQAEPEVGLICEIEYDGDKIKRLNPKAFCACNDASMRIKADKISKKKNFSNGSKAIGAPIFIDTFESGGICDSYSLTSFIMYKNKNTEILKRYGEVAKLLGYTYFYDTLIKWLEKSINTQKDEEALQAILPLLADKPKEAIISIGATRYMDIAQKRYLRQGDKICIAVFNHKKYNFRDIRNMFVNDKFESGISFITQTVI